MQRRGGDLFKVLLSCQYSDIRLNVIEFETSCQRGRRRCVWVSAGLEACPDIDSLVLQ